MGKLTKAIGVAGAVAGAAYLSKSENRKKTKLQFNKVINKLGSQYVKDWGKPEEIDDAHMVDEGAMTSVQYYNEVQQESQDAKSK
ncbi:hypothetical protein JOC34_003006 [Virgibacillus halotolerans]|uniref:hypothetical protein n=1 Tax=Virgibacillus halotolerans TaxID=1071053 RepID=UPI001960D416|nr:hypothetical protein [Virgibacillus halotolerans]MBM7600595.1 hypothetical protein [Virgibacillus halotolerans]